MEKAKEGDEDTFDLIEKQLEEQKDICSENAKVYEKLGNLGAASQYKNMADTCQRDLLAIKGIRKQVRERGGERGGWIREDERGWYTCTCTCSWVEEMGKGLAKTFE